MKNQDRKTKFMNSVFYKLILYLYFFIFAVYLLFLLILLGTLNSLELFKKVNLALMQSPSNTLIIFVISTIAIALPFGFLLLIENHRKFAQVDDISTSVDLLKNDKIKIENDIKNINNISSQLEKKHNRIFNELENNIKVHRLNNKVKTNYDKLFKLNKSIYKIAKNSKLSSNTKIKESWKNYLHSVENLKL